jgi:hypothetical protein
MYVCMFKCVCTSILLLLLFLYVYVPMIVLYCCGRKPVLAPIKYYCIVLYTYYSCSSHMVVSMMSTIETPQRLNTVLSCFTIYWGDGGKCFQKYRIGAVTQQCKLKYYWLKYDRMSSSVFRICTPTYTCVGGSLLSRLFLTDWPNWLMENSKDYSTLKQTKYYTG